MAAAGADSPVPTPDLRLLFATNASDLEAVSIFVDRHVEQEAFDRAVRGHWRHVTDPAFDVQDVLAPRRNIMVLYGMGGVGKTTLSRELEHRHAGRAGPRLSSWPPMVRDFERSVQARVDLASESGLDFEKLLLTIRLAVAGLNRPMHAFDLAFSRYWEHNHPNEALSDYLSRNATAARVTDESKLPDQIKAGLEDIAAALGGSNTLVSVTTRLVANAVSAIRRKQVQRHAVQECRRLAALLQADPDIDSLSYYPYLLAWDLAELTRKRGGDTHVAVFVDTFEDIGSGDDQRRLERLFNRLVWLMPNVLFVVSSRNRLDWHSHTAEGQLDRTGPVSWPSLVVGATAEPTQHLVGQLGPEDSGNFLRERLRRGEDPAIPEDIRAQIAAESGGYPLYLDLAVTRYLQIVGTGRSPVAADFIGGFPALVTRILRDLPAEERRLLRVLSLLDAFDSDLAATVADLPSEAAAVRLINRAFVEVDEDAPFPFSIHRLLRQQVRDSDAGADAFSARDWARYAQRSFDELGRRYEDAVADRDRPIVISTLNQALRLGDEYDLGIGWCVDAAYSFIADNVWESSLRPPVDLTTVRTPAAALAQALLAIVDRQVNGRREAARILTDVLASNLLTGDARDLARYYLAEAMREIGRGDEAEPLLRELATSGSRMGEFAAKGLTHWLRRLGRFQDALAQIESQPRTGIWLRQRGTLYWSHGMLTEAIADYTASRAWFLDAGNPGEAAEAAGCLAFVCGLAGEVRPGNRELVVAGLTALNGSRNTWATLMARLGSALLDADGGPDTDALLRTIGDAGRSAGLSSIMAYAYFGHCLNAALSGDGARLREARSELAAWTSGVDFRALVEAVDFWFEPPPDDWAEFAGADWVGGVDLARQRWQAILTDRRTVGRQPA